MIALGPLALTALAATAPLRAEGTELWLTGAHVLDSAGQRWLDGRVVRVRDGRIVAVEAPPDGAWPEGARRVELDGLYLTPGLIDLHTHLCLHPYDETSWEDQVLRESLELRTIRAVAAARATLEAGFTTIRELGTEGAGYADVALRDAVADGMMPGPRILASTRAIVATGCYGPAGFDPHWETPKGAQEATGPDEVRRVVREQIAKGADWIKVYEDYRRRPGGASTPTFSAAELAAAVEEATSAGLPVAAHATTDEGVRRAAEAGVVTIEHGTGASAETLAFLAARGVVLCPTLTAGLSVARYQGWDGSAPEPERVVELRAFFERALASGVTIACGSDAGVFRHGTNAQELEWMVRWGMTPADALRSATSVAASVLRREDLGAIAPGMTADLVLFAGDPLEDASALEHPLVVVQEGRIVVDRR